jgi:hypothetical protein
MHRREGRRTAAARRARCRLGGATPLGPSDGVYGTVDRRWEVAPLWCLRNLAGARVLLEPPCRPRRWAPPRPPLLGYPTLPPSCRHRHAGQRHRRAAQSLQPQTQAVPTGWRWPGAGARLGAGMTDGDSRLAVRMARNRHQRAAGSKQMAARSYADRAGAERGLRGEGSGRHGLYERMRRPQQTRSVRSRPRCCQRLIFRVGAAAQLVVVDCRTHMLGRLASVVAKQLLLGQHVVRPPASLRPSRRPSKPHLGDLLLGFHAWCRVTPRGQKALRELHTRAA